LKERYNHETGDTLLDIFRHGTFAKSNAVLPGEKELKHFIIDTAKSMVAIARMKGDTTLVGEFVKESTVSRSKSMRAFQGTGIKGNGKIPGMDAFFVAAPLQTAFLALDDGTVEFVLNCHPDIHIDSCLLNNV
jgi:hypothetical protein